MRSAFRSGFGQNSVARLTTTEFGKHRVVSKHPQEPLFCTHTVICGLKIWKSEQHDELGNVSHSLNEVAGAGAGAGAASLAVELEGPQRQ